MSDFKLYRHQAMAVACMSKHDRWGFWWDCGTGKTHAILAGLNLSKQAWMLSECDKLRPAGGTLIETFSGWRGAETPDGDPAVECKDAPPPYLKTCVVCPKPIMRNAWERDGQMHPHLDIRVCWANTAAKRKALIAEPGADVLVINFECFKKHVDDLLAAGVRRIVVDESSKMKNPSTKITQAVIDFADKMDSVYLLSGTPAPNGQHEYWAQMRAIDKSLFGDSFWRFTNKYLFEKSMERKGKKIVLGYNMRPSMADEFAALLKSKSWALSKAEAVDLPRQVDVVRSVDLSTTEQRAYDLASEDLRLELESGKEFGVRAEGLANKLRQLSSGWAYTPGDPEHYGASKLDALDELLDEIGPREPVVIWADFRHDAATISDLLDKRKERHVCLDGNFKGDSFDVVTEFQAGKLPRLVCHPASVGHGVTLHRACYSIFYSLPWSYELYQQARDRIHRSGQDRPCTHYHLISDGTIDRAVLMAVRGKKRKAEAVLSMLKGVE